MPYKYIEDVAIADLAIEVSADSVSALFEDAGMALANAMANPKTVEPKTKQLIELESDKIDSLLFDFLSEFITLKDADSFLVNSLSVSVTQNAGKWKVSCVAEGEAIDRKRHELRNDVKAVTFHMFKVEQVGKQWNAFVVVDI